MKSILFLLLLPALAAIACRSPLDVDTPRVDSLLINNIKLRTASVMVRSINGSLDTITIANWPYVVDSTMFQSDLRSDPPPITIYYGVRRRPLSAVGMISLEKLSFWLSDVVPGTLVDLTNNATPGSGVRAEVNINIGGTPTTYVTNSLLDNYTANAVMSYAHGNQKLIDGRIEVLLEANKPHQLKIIATFQASQD